LSTATRGGGAGRALGSRVMRHIAHRTSSMVAYLVMALVLASFASRAHALAAADDVPEASEPVATYAST
jgi:preprotein translocase subunit SecG